jgi:hypothetical protein
MGLFTRRRRQATDTGGLGSSVIALRLDDGDIAPVGAAVVIFNAAGYARRAAAGRVSPDEGEIIYCVHPGPYGIDLTPFAAAPELGLRLRFLIDASDPRVAQQRFDLFLSSEAEAQLGLAAFGAAIESALQAELKQGNLDLPPCTALEEWHAFRAGLNQLLYTRFGITVDDCVPVDLGDSVDFAQMLAARAVRLATDVQLTVDAPVPEAAPSPVAAQAAIQPAVREADSKSLRRLFLELPALTSGFRLLVLPAGQAAFQSHRKLLQRLGLISLSVGTMPSLDWAAPGQPSPALEQNRRSADSAQAVQSLDEAWALLARLQLAVPVQLDPLFDDADRIVSNLEYHLRHRRAVSLVPDADDSPDEEAAPRKEPSL